MIRPIRHEELAEVEAIYRACHPTWPARPAEWYIGFPTLICRAKGRIVGFTSMSLSWPPTELQTTKGYVLWGHDVCVHPEAQGRGVGWRLCEARLAFGRTLGAHFFLGMTWPGNKPMIRIFERQGCIRRPEHIAEAYPNNEPGHRLGMLYTRGL